MKLTCGEDGTQFEVVLPLPMPVSEFCAKLDAAACPSCGTTVKTGKIYMGWKDSEAPTGASKQ